jgi:hypothetical protein
MLVSLHIPKTGGTSFNEILKSNFRKLLTISGQQEILNFLRMPLAERSSYPAAAGHMPFGIDRYVTVPCQYIVFLRDPVDHTISAYYYVLRTPDTHQHDRARKMTLREYVESDLWPINDNQQTRRLSDFDWAEAVNLGPSGMVRPCPCNQEHLRQAKATLDRCEFVGLFDRFEDSVRLCCDRFGLTCATIPRLNATPGRPASQDIDPDVGAIIRERRRFDVELYEHAVRRYNSFTATMESGSAASNRLHARTVRDQREASDPASHVRRVIATWRNWFLRAESRKGRRKPAGLLPQARRDPNLPRPIPPPCSFTDAPGDLEQH